MRDVVIVGGGIIGLSVAWELAKSGAGVTLVDQSTPGTEASWAGAGMIPPGDRDGEASHALAAWSSKLWPALTEELRDQTGIDGISKAP